jgi:hypothetical protein
MEIVEKKKKTCIVCNKTKKLVKWHKGPKCGKCRREEKDKEYNDSLPSRFRDPNFCSQPSDDAVIIAGMVSCGYYISFGLKQEKKEEKKKRWFRF